MKKKILIISKLPPPFYGTTVWSEILLKSKLTDGFNIIHLNNNANKTLSDLGKPSLRKILFNIFVYFKLIKLVIKNKPDLVFIPISQTTIGFLKDSLFIWISYILRRRVLLILHGADFKNWQNSTNFINRFFVTITLKRAVGVVVLGKKLRYLFADYYSEENIFSVPNGANYNFGNYSKHGTNTIGLLFLANLLPTKGVKEAIEAISHIKEEDIKLNIIGGSDNLKFHNELTSYVKRKNLPTEFLGVITGEEKYRCLLNCDIFIFPPNAPEGHPYVLIEAMAAGLPIISTDQGAITESVIDGVNGFIVEPRNPKQIAEKIQYLIDNPDVRVKMGKESRRLYEENFTEEKMVERLANVFQTVLQND